ncbi:MAG: hypothetical protein ACR2OH_01975, partial [Microthrixaceae bacterium]
MTARMTARMTMRVGTAILTAVVTSIVVLFVAPSAGAGGGGGAGVSGSGDEIISSILAATGNGYVKRSTGKAPTCYWRTLTDEQVLYLVHVQASMPHLLASGFGTAIDDYVESVVVKEAPPPTTTTTTTTTLLQPVPPETTPELAVPEEHATRVFGGATVSNFRLKVRICSGVADTMAVVANEVTGNLARGLAAVRSVAVLPAPTVALAPSGRAVLGEPVFIDVEQPSFESQMLSLAGSTVVVNATPKSLAVFDGQYADDVGRTISCDFEAGFDPLDEASPLTQSQRPGTCAFHYTRINGDLGDGKPARTDSWVGYAKVQWDVSYTITAAGGLS